MNLDAMPTATMEVPKFAEIRVMPGVVGDVAQFPENTLVRAICPHCKGVHHYTGYGTRQCFRNLFLKFKIMRPINVW